MNIDLKKTIAQIGKQCNAQNVQYLVLSDPASIYYLTGCAAHAAGDFYALVAPISSKPRVILFTDARYEGTVKKITAKEPMLEIVIWDRKTLWNDILGFTTKGTSVGFEKNNQSTTLSLVQGLRAAGRKHGVGIRGVDDMMQIIRSIKSPAELKLLRRAHALSDEAFKQILEHIKPGMTELEISQHLGFILRQLSGEEELSFATIVASGPNGGIPHATPGTRKIRDGDMVTLDFGLIYKGYHSDMTRTIFVNSIDPEKADIYDIVLKAQSAAEKQARPGMTGQDIDRIARTIIDDAGYGKFFCHSTGHGVGIDIHEKPHVTYTEPGANVLEVGMVFSIEPGIYIPGKFGVRIENVVVMTKTGAKSMSKANKGIIAV